MEAVFSFLTVANRKRKRATSFVRGTSWLVAHLALGLVLGLLPEALMWVLWQNGVDVFSGGSLTALVLFIWFGIGFGFCAYKGLEATEDIVGPVTNDVLGDQRFSTKKDLAKHLGHHRERLYWGQIAK